MYYWKEETSVHTNFKTADYVTGIQPVPTELHLNTPAGCAGQLETSSKALLRTRKTTAVVVTIIIINCII